jgi:hypothetical protein
MLRQLLKMPEAPHWREIPGCHAALFRASIGANG